MKRFFTVKQLKMSAYIAATFFSAGAAAFTVMGISLDSFNPNLQWDGKLKEIVLIYLLLLIIVFIVRCVIFRRGGTFNINGITVSVKRGDIFKATGWKLIPCTEYYDTIVDDIVIAKSSLNGLFIQNCVANLPELNERISGEKELLFSDSQLPSSIRIPFPLGHIITYGDEFMLLAFAHFDENTAHISRTDYERCLMSMWKEIRRVYANKPVTLPLIGSGITSFDDIPRKSNYELLKCMLCTLRASGENINQPITILLTKEIMQEINVYEMKGAV